MPYASEELGDPGQHDDAPTAQRRVTLAEITRPAPDAETLADADAEAAAEVGASPLHYDADEISEGS
jgi:hypothetical protein